MDFESYLASEIKQCLAAFGSDGRWPYAAEGDNADLILRKAGRILERFPASPGANPNLCLASGQKSTVLAAIVASLSGGPSLIIPYSLSEPVVAEAAAALGAAGVLSDRPLALPSGTANLVLPDEAASSPLTPKLSRDPGAPFLWLFTGGSTGRPKVWSKTPLNLVGESIYLRDTFMINAGDTIVATVPPYHIYGLLFSVLLPWVSRARVVNQVPYFPREIISALRDFRGSVLVGSPAHYKALANVPLESPSLKIAFSSGGFLDPGHGIGFFRQNGIGIVEVYGSTETGGVAARRYAQGRKTWTPFAPHRVRVSEERLCVASPFLSPDLARDPEGFFRTGDRAAESVNGTFTLLGRADDIVKIGGNRIDIAEIEQKITGLPGVEDAFVFAVPVAEGRENEIAALVVSLLDNSGLRSLLASALSPLEMPRRFKIVKQIPLSATGKRDHKAALELLAK
ncbi:MAG: fatty acid--CoA ligase family protein [bacterium]|nr:fatty acid--CoA ligase family protein [bacterium]